MGWVGIGEYRGGMKMRCARGWRGHNQCGKPFVELVFLYSAM